MEEKWIILSLLLLSSDMQIARSALRFHDYDACYDTCMNLIKASYTAIWQVCKELGECEQFTNISKRMQMVCVLPHR